MTMTYVLILLLGPPTTYSDYRSLTAVTLPMLNEPVCMAAYEKAKAHWGDRLKGGQCIATIKQ